MSATAGLAPWRIGQLPGRLRFLLLMLLYAALVALCLVSLWSAGELSMGRNQIGRASCRERV